MPEQDLFVDDAAGVRVTTARLVVPGQTIVIRGITAIRSAYIPANRFPGIVTALLGALVAVAGLAGGGESAPAAFIVGVPLVLGGLLMMMLARSAYRLSVVSASGEGYSFRDDVRDKQGLEKALNAAVMLADARLVSPRREEAFAEAL